MKRSTGILVSDHALDRARERYGLVNVDVGVIHGDVCDALRAGRAGKWHPFHPGQACMGNAIYAWSPGMKRLYVIEGVRRANRRGFLRVLTALPGRHADLVEDVERWAA